MSIYDVVLYWYMGIIFWVVLIVSTGYLTLGLSESNRKYIKFSAIIFIPNAIFLLMNKLELIMYAFYILWLVELLLLWKWHPIDEDEDE